MTDTRIGIELGVPSPYSDEALALVQKTAEDALPNTAPALAAALAQLPKLPFSTIPVGADDQTVVVGNDQRIPDVVSAETNSALPTVMTGMRVIPEQDGVLTATGNVNVRNPATGDVAIWDVKAAVKSEGGIVSLVGNPLVGLFGANPALESWAGADPPPIAVTEGSGGIALTVTGLANTPLIWRGSFLMVGG